MKKELRGSEKKIVENVLIKEEKKINGKITGGSIRIHQKEYKNIDKSLKYISHFNLQVCHHKVGMIYALPRILKHGFFTKEKEQLPEMSYENIIIGECVDVRENLHYADLTEEDFKYSFKNIKNIEELKKIILERYGMSTPDLSEERILELGISITKLKIING